MLWVGLFAVYMAASVGLLLGYCTGSSGGAAWVTGLSYIAGVLALPFTLYSSFVVFEGIRHGRICTKSMAKKGARQIAKIIKSFSPDVIVFVAGNSEDLFNDYIADNLVSSYHTLALPACIRYKRKPYLHDTVLLTNKFFINVSLLSKIAPNARVVIFDDVTKTGETINVLKEYLTTTRKLPVDNIMTCGFIVDKYGYAKSAEPAFYFKRTEVSDDYTFPWRKR